MPCWTITTVKLELKNASLDLLKKALEAQGKQNIYVNTAMGIVTWGYGRDGYNKNTGQISVQTKSDGNAIRRAYSAEVVKKTASRFGWQVQQSGENRFAIIKR